MSTRNITRSGLPAKILPGATYMNSDWVRNPSWLPLASIASNEQKFTGLYAVYPFNNFISLLFVTSGGAQYTVDWGDGSAPVNVNSNVQANYQYDFNDADLANTNAPVTFNATTNRVERTNHGYVDGMTISFNSITTTTGISATETYFVINATANDFQLTRTLNGSIITLVGNGSGIILPFKQVVVTVTPVSGNFTTCNISTLHPGYSIGAWLTGWLDVAMAGSYTTISINGSNLVRNGAIQRVQILSSALTSFANLFQNLFDLSSVPVLASSQTVTNASALFINCYSINQFPTFPTTFTNVQNMFSTCASMKRAPYFVTTNVTNMTNFLAACRSLTEVPLYDTSNVTNMTNMFLDCQSLREIPRFNTSNVTIMNTTFQGCRSLDTIPQLDTSKVTQMIAAFYLCTSLTRIPTLNTSNVTTMQSTFNFCSALPTIPQLDTSKVTDMSFMFNNCASLVSLPLLNTSNVTTMSEILRFCSLLEVVPAWNTQKVTDLKDAFGSCNNLRELNFFDTRACTNFNVALAGCTLLGAVNLDLRSINNFSDFGSWFTGLRTLYSLKLPNCAATGIAPTNCGLGPTALNELYTSLAPCGGSCTFQATPDTVTKTAHGYSEGQPIRFSTITTTTGIAINTRYFVRNPTADTFQLSTTLTGAIINLVNDGSGTITAYTITVSGNWGTTGDDPTIATNKGWTVTGS